MKSKSSTAWIVKITTISIVASAVFALTSSELLQRTGYIISFAILSAFIVIGIAFDIIGIAVTAADEAPFNSMAARNRRGAAEALLLIKNANRVTSYCNDVIGDVTGIISGTTAALIAARIINNFDFDAMLFPVIISAVVTGLTVGGKAIGKIFAFSKSTGIVLGVGRLFNLLHLKPFAKKAGKT